MPKINRQNLRKSHQIVWFLIDFLMLGLLTLNLGLLIFDSIYSFISVQNLMARYTPALRELYQPIHESFIFIDAVFVTVFVTEFFLRWLHAARKRVYDRWYFYPFLHWYDLVGCIPVGSLRMLRVLRVLSIIYRLHQHGVVDVTQWRVYRFASFYYEAFMEELSDRIVVKVISGVQDEVKEGSPLFDRIQDDILRPRQAMIAGWLSDRIAEAARQGYLPNQAALRRYLETRVENSLESNQELGRLRLLPVVGPTLLHTLEHSVGDIVADVIHQILSDLASASNHAFVDDLVEAFLPATPHSPQDLEVRNEALIQLIVEILEAVKVQVAVKRWRASLP